MKPTEYRRRRDLIWRRVRQQMRSILMFDGVPVTPEQREAAAQKILFPVRRARDESTQLATAFYNDEAVRFGRQPSRPRRSPFYPREAVEAVLERATASKVRVDGLDVIPATPTQTVRVEGLEVAPTRGVVIEGLDDLGVELEHARVEIDESNRRDPAVVEKVNLRVDRAIIRHIEQAARDTVKAAVEAEEERSGDPIGWARVLTGAESCGFCAMLASRGPIYKTEETAQRRGRNQEEDKYHDGCDCLIVPVFDIDDAWVGKDAWEALEELWIDSDSRKDFEKRFRTAKENRDDDVVGGLAWDALESMWDSNDFDDVYSKSGRLHPALDIERTGVEADLGDDLTPVDPATARRARRDISRGLTRIEELHPLINRNVVVRSAHAPDAPNKVRRRGAKGMYTADRRMWIRYDGQTIEATTIHEYFHHIDLSMAGDGVIPLSGLPRDKWPREMADLIDVIEASQPIRDLDRFVGTEGALQARDKDQRDYLRQRPEMLARAYAQWVATETSSVRLQRALTPREQLGPDQHRQWSSEEFEPIRRAMSEFVRVHLRP